ncbi:MAG: hypothetical protein DRR19_03120 [Candidatus Parabeggiatoa sp. nov. 1]|nr:MAG: hypothetical protein DRR19_03120 [Gammaproteobacteria bacterium]
MLSLGFAIVSLFCKSVQIVMLSLGFAIVSLFGTLKSSSHDAIAWFCDSITFWYFEKFRRVGKRAALSQTLSQILTPACPPFFTMKIGNTFKP